MKKIESQPIAFTGGGSGGHVYPAKPIIDRLLEDQPHSLYWIGSSNGIEKEIVEGWVIPFKGIPSGKLRRYFSWQNFTDIFKILAGFFVARGILKKNPPLYLFSKGGFVSVPPVLAAKSLGIPTYTHDSDVTPGLATRINSRVVRKIFLPYEKSLKYTSSKFRYKTVVSGNPVRPEFFTGDPQEGRDYLKVPNNLPILLVLGGSLGASHINSLVEESLDELTKFCFVVHQTGTLNFTPLERENYHRAPFFLDELYSIMAAASGALSRSGAGSIWELSASKTPMLLLPLGACSRGDQAYNAQVFEESGAAKILNEKTLTSIELVEQVSQLLSKEGKRDWEKINRALNMGQAQTIILNTIEEDLKL